MSSQNYVRRQLIQSNQLTRHPHFDTAYQEKKYLNKKKWSGRQTIQNTWSLPQLRRAVPVEVANSWPRNIRWNYKAPYVNHIIHQLLERLYVIHKYINMYIYLTIYLCTYICIYMNLTWFVSYYID